MLNQIYIHYINTLFVLESFIISCWLLKGKKIGIGIGIGQFAQKKSVSESATKNHDRCITIQNTVFNFTLMKMRLLERNRTLLVSVRNARCEDYRSHVIFKTHNF